MIDNLRQHKFSSIMPEIPADEFEQVVADIKAKGLLEPVWLYQGQVLDGWHRYKAALEAGVEPKTREYKGKDPLGFVKSMNLMRRHLDKSGRTLLRVMIEKEEGTKAQEGSQHDQADHVTTLAGLAKEMGVGTATVQRARAVVAKAPELIPHVLKDEDDPTRLPLKAAEEVAKMVAREAKPEKRQKIIEHQIKVRTGQIKPRAPKVEPIEQIRARDWSKTPAVKEVIDLLRGFNFAAIKRMADQSKFSPEAARFVALRMRQFADSMRQMADYVERSTK